MSLWRSRRSWLAALSVAAIFALVGGAAGASGNSPGRGVEILVSPIAAPGVRVTNADLARSVEIMRNRLAQLGDQGSVTRKPGSEEIEIRLDGLSLVTARSQAQTISKTGRVEFYDLTPSLLAPSIDSSHQPVPATSLYSLLTQAHPGTGAPSAFYLFNTKSQKIAAGPDNTLTQLLPDRKVPAGMAVATVPSRAAVVTCGSTTTRYCPGLTQTPVAGVTYYYLFKHGTYPGDTENPYPQLSGDDLSPTGALEHVDPSTGAPVVAFQFTSTGAKLFHAITRDEAQRGQALGVVQGFAIVVDDQLYSAPVIDYNTYPDGIEPTGRAEITGLTTPAEAKQLAVVLHTGQLPVQFTVLSARTAG